MKLKGIMLSEVGQKQKDNISFHSYMNIKKQANNKKKQNK